MPTTTPTQRTPDRTVPLRQGQYRPDIDGLRAFSILSVIIFHAFPKALPGGFIGVDVFFVISGFLISGIILKSTNAGAFSYVTFYSRRIKRIFPALIIVLVASMLAGWLFLLPDEWKSLDKHVFAGAAFISNIALMREGGYFESGANPLLHLWSLGIEEQFYIAWPLLLAFVCRRRATILPAILLTLSLSFTLNLWYVEKKPSIVFYFPAMRFWELALGALLAYVTLFRSKARLHGLSLRFLDNPGVSFALSLSGLLLLASSLVLISETKAFPGGWALLPTMGAFLTIAAGPTAWFNRFVLSCRPIVFLGLISYPLYLWHWPILVFAKLLGPTGSTWPVAIAVLSSITLSYLTYKFIEGPLRHHRSAIAIPSLLALSVGFIGLCGLVCSSKVRPRLQSSESLRVVADAIADWDYPFGSNWEKSSGFQTGRVGSRGGEQVLFIGDSHAEQYYARVKALIEGHPEQFPTSMFATYAGCPPLPRINRSAPGYACDNFFDYSMTQANDPRITRIVFCAFWEAYFGYQVDGDRVSNLYYTGEHPPIKRSAKELAALVFTDFGRSIKSLTAHGKRVFVILSNPTSNLYNPMNMLSRITGAMYTRDLDRRALDTSRPILDLLRAVAVQSGATVIDPVPYMCRGPLCRTAEDGVPLYRDDNHLRSSYAKRYAVFVDQVYK